MANYYVGTNCIIDMDKVACAYQIRRDRQYSVHVLFSGVEDDYYLLSGQQATDFWQYFKALATGRENT